MKAILVIDFPKSCYACPLSQVRDGVNECYITKSNQGTCPLKPMPKKIDILKQSDKDPDGKKE